jgi:hypothetical protein
MKKQPYLPKREPERVIWLNTFAAKIGAYAATVGITPAEVTLIGKMAAFYAYIIGLVEMTKTFTQTLTQFKDTLTFAPIGTVLGAIPTLTPGAAPPVTDAGIFTVISGYVSRIKASSAYTTSIGEDLGIIGDETTFDEGAYAPEIKGETTPDGAKVKFTKKGVDGINVYSRSKGDSTWEKLAFDSSSPYLDARPLQTPGTPEVREYRGRGVINDVEIGQFSDIISITIS